MKEILFKDDDYLMCGYIASYSNLDLINIKHLDDTKPLYNYIDNITNERFSVYYEYNGTFITNNIGYSIFTILENYVKDYTLANLNLLENENII